MQESGIALPVPQRGTEKLNALFSSDRVDLQSSNASFTYVPPQPKSKKPDAPSATPTSSVARLAQHPVHPHQHHRPAASQ